MIAGEDGVMLSETRWPSPSYTPIAKSKVFPRAILIVGGGRGETNGEQYADVITGGSPPSEE